MVCVAGCQHPSVPQVKGHTVKHSYWQTEADRGIKTEETILLPASLWDFTELCRITVCSSLSAMLLSQWPDWFTEYYEHCIIAVYPHICDSWIFVGSIHKHLQSSLTNMKQWKVKEPGKLHNTVCWEGSNCPLPRFKTFSKGNVLYPYVFELLQIIYALRWSCWEYVNASFDSWPLDLQSFLNGYECSPTWDGGEPSHNKTGIIWDTDDEILNHCKAQLHFTCVLFSSCE